MKKEQKNEQIEVFVKLYEDFVAKCKKEGIVPVTALQYTVTGIFPYLDFVEYQDDKKKE